MQKPLPADCVMQHFADIHGLASQPLTGAASLDDDPTDDRLASSGAQIHGRDHRAGPGTGPG